MYDIKYKEYQVPTRFFQENTHKLIVCELPTIVNQGEIKLQYLSFPMR